MSAEGTGSARYVEAIILQRQRWIYYKVRRIDDPHELCLVRVLA